MGIPKNRKPVAARKNRSQIEQAIRMAGSMQTPGVTLEEGSARRSEMPTVEIPETRRVAKSPARAPEERPAPVAQPQPPMAQTAPPPPPPAAPVADAATKQIGRPPLKENRTERVTAWMTPDNRDRLRMALYGEQLKTRGKTDQSLIIEMALEKWLDDNGY